MTEYKKFTVHVEKQFPAWDEKGGWDMEVEAKTKADAVKFARRRTETDGNCGFSGGGRTYFKATEIKEGD